MDKMILGAGDVVSMDSRKTGLNNNVIVCGTSGCGKTMSISEPLLLETCEKSLIATVTKRRLVHEYTPLFERRGYVVEDLNLIRPEESTVSFDPLDYMATPADVTFFAEAVAGVGRDENDTGDPFWEQQSVSLLSAEIALVLEKQRRRDAEEKDGAEEYGEYEEYAGEENEEEEDREEEPGASGPEAMSRPRASFLDVLELQENLKLKESNSGYSTSLDDEFENLRTKWEDVYDDSDGENGSDSEWARFAVTCWGSFRDLPIVTARCVYGALNTAMNAIFTPQLRAMFGKERRVDFGEMGTRRTVLFVSTSAVSTSMHCFANLFYAQAFKSLFEFAERQPGGRLPVPVHVLCDDFAAGCRIESFPEYISIFREKQISVTLLIQSESQLSGMYGQSNATTIINNCDTYIYMGGMDLETGDSVSIRLNRPLREVLNLPIGREVIFRRGRRPLETQRYDILHDPRWQALHEEKRERGAA